MPVRPPNFWADCANLDREMRAFVTEPGRPQRMPTLAELVAAGRAIVQVDPPLGIDIDAQNGTTRAAAVRQMLHADQFVAHGLHHRPGQIHQFMCRMRHPPP